MGDLLNDRFVLVLLAIEIALDAFDHVLDVAVLVLGIDYCYGRERYTRSDGAG